MFLYVKMNKQNCKFNKFKIYSDKFEKKKKINLAYTV